MGFIAMETTKAMSWLALVTMGSWLCYAQDVPKSASIPLWEGDVPYAKVDAPQVPALDIYLPVTNATHTAVVVCPGGGYGGLVMSYEGAEVAQWLAKHGVAAFVLHYRVAPYQYPAPMLDALRAMRLIRSQASKYDVSADHIGVWGFSAGGHVASYLMTHFDEHPPLSAGFHEDTVDTQSARPDFGILAYAVISMTPGVTHPGSRTNLLGPNGDPDLEQKLSNASAVKPNSPPAFLFSTTDDQTVPVLNSVQFYLAYVEKNLPVEMYLAEHGPHGVGLATNRPGAEAWPSLLASWMTRHGWMKSE
jgi:acetyl esterase/lipase